MDYDFPAEVIVGHRANFVFVRDGKATAYHDQWAALGSTYAFAGGPDEAVATAELSEPTTELLDWAFAEAGYLLDFDERRAIVFGTPEPIDFESEELEEFAVSQEEAGQASELETAVQRGPLDFLQFIAGRWKGWLLEWDDRGVDAFSAHLARRGIHTLTTQPDSHPPDRVVVSFQA